MHGVQQFRLSDRAADLGLACNRRGLDLAGVPLLQEDRGRFRPRPPDQIGRLLTRAYRVRIEPGQLTGGLRAVANALNDGDVARAMIAALWLRLPPLDWDGAARIAQSDDALQKYDEDEPRDWRGRWTTDGGTAAHQPAADTARPSVDVRADGSYQGLPRAGDRNPLLHLTAAEEDDDGRGGLLGDFIDLPRELRLQVYQSLQERLREIEPGNPQLQSLTSPDYSPSQADIDALTGEVHDAQERVGELPNTAWEKGWAARGQALEVLRLRGMRILPSNTPTIDDFPYKVAVSIKSIDLNAPWYRNPAIVSYRINRYVDNLSRFNELSWGDFKIKKRRYRR